VACQSSGARTRRNIEDITDTRGRVTDGALARIKNRREEKGSGNKQMRQLVRWSNYRKKGTKDKGCRRADPKVGKRDLSAGNEWGRSCKGEERDLMQWSKKSGWSGGKV